MLLIQNVAIAVAKNIMDNKIMPEKHMFSYSWVGLSDINALQYVEYLIVHYADFDISIKRKEIKIGQDIIIKSKRKKKKDIYEINGRTFDAEFDCKQISILVEKCKESQQR